MDPTSVANVEVYARDLLSRIEEAIPLLSLALTTSGANLSSSLPESVSPGRVLLASKHLSDADDQFEKLLAETKHELHSKDTGNEEPLCVQVGPKFSLKLYTVFLATAHNATVLRKDVTWKEELARCTVHVVRVASKDGMRYAYELKVTEDFNDGRYHEEETPRSRTIDVSVITRLFFSASGQLLAIEESKSPVLVLKLNKAFHPGNVIAENESFNADDGVEWLAFEVFDTDDSDTEDSDDSDDGEWVDEDKDDDNSNAPTISAKELARRMGDLALSAESTSELRNRSSLSLLEYLLRLSALQSTDQDTVFNIHDERIALYLRDDAGRQTGGASAGSGIASQMSTPESDRRTVSASRHRRQHSSSPSVTPLRKSSSPAGRRVFETPNLRRFDEAQTPSNRKAETTTSPYTPWERDRMRRNPFLSRVISMRNSPLKPRQSSSSVASSPRKPE